MRRYKIRKRIVLVGSKEAMKGVWKRHFDSFTNEKIVRKTKVFCIGMKVNEEYLCRKYLVGRG